MRMVAAMVGPRRDGAEVDERATGSSSRLSVSPSTRRAAGRITFFNEAAVELWGRRPELGEEWCGSWKLFWPDGRPMLHGECRWPSRSTRTAGPRADGDGPAAGRHVRRLRAVSDPLRDADGRLVGAVNVMVDITERRVAEEELRAQRPSRSLPRTPSRTSSSASSRTSLRTPLTTIYGNAQLLIDGRRRRRTARRSGWRWRPTSPRTPIDCWPSSRTCSCSAGSGRRTARSRAAGPDPGRPRRGRVVLATPPGVPHPVAHVPRRDDRRRGPGVPHRSSSRTC